MTTVRRLGVLSVFKITAVIYGLMFAVFGCLFLVLPGLIGSSLLGGMAEESGLGLFGGGIVATLIAYVGGIFLFSLIYGVISAIGAVIYNLVAGWIGGIEVDIS